MTYVEFFDKNAIENICSCFTAVPERVIFIGDKIKQMKAHIKRYEKIFSDRGLTVEFAYRSINKNKLQDIVETLSAIVEVYDDCVFDLTGGEELCLVAMGIVFDRYPEKNICMHRFNIRNNTIIDCDQDGVTIYNGELPSITVQENIRIYGGDVVYDDVKVNATHRWDMNEAFKADIYTMWDICKQDARGWNAQMGVFSATEVFYDETLAVLTTIAPTPDVLGRLSSVQSKFLKKNRIVEELKAAGLIKAFNVDENFVTITYKNEQVKRCLIKAGQILEMKIFCAALDCHGSDGVKTYDDAVNGVVIDWDGIICADNSKVETENEIDVLMMHGMVPVFVSCKNGFVEMEELFKLNTVAERFGGKYAKKVLVVTELEDTVHTAYLQQRANDMGIRVISDLKQMSNDDLERAVRLFWCN